MTEQQWPYMVGGPKHGEQVAIRQSNGYWDDVLVAIHEPRRFKIDEPIELSFKTGVYKPYYYHMLGGDWVVYIWEHHNPYEWPPHEAAWPNLSLCECTREGDKYP